MNAREPVPPASRENPFPKVPEVTLRGRSPGVTVATKAVEEANAFILDYLSADDGRSLAIVGDYGAGKSHLAGYVIEQVLNKNTQAIVCVVRAEFKYTLLDIYKHLFYQNGTGNRKDTRQIGLVVSDLLRRVTDVYSEMAQEHRREVEYPIVTTRRRARNEHSPWPGGATLADDVELTRVLQARLTEITQDHEIANGLSLLLHNDGEISNHAWEWLRGGQVTPHLKKRGVNNEIDENRAIDALDGIARLFNDGLRRFVLVVDDFERLNGKEDGDSGRLDSVASSLIRWAADSKSLLVTSVGDRHWDRLSEGVRQRIGRIIRPVRFTEEHIKLYQDECLRRQRESLIGQAVFDERPAEFSQATVAKIRDVSWGTPRRVVKICYDAYDHPEKDGRITPDTIERVASNLFGWLPASEIYPQIRDFFSGQGQTVRRDHMVGTAKAPLWISAGSDKNGCAVVVTESVLNPQSADGLVGLGEALGGATGEPTSHAFVLVLAGLIAESLEPRVLRVFPKTVQWGKDTFWNDLQAMIGGSIASPGAVAESALRELRIAISGLRSSQAEDHHLLTQMAVVQEEGHMRKMIREETHRAYLRSPAHDPLSFGDLDEIQRIFDDAILIVQDGLGRGEELWLSIFQLLAPARQIDRSRAPGRRRALPTDLTSDTMVRTIGILTILEDSLYAFGRSVIQFQQLSKSDRETFRADFHGQCTSFDKMSETIIKAIPSIDDDPGNIVFRGLGIDRSSMIARFNRIGAAVFNGIHASEYRRR